MSITLCLQLPKPLPQLLSLTMLDVMCATHKYTIIGVMYMLRALTVLPGRSLDERMVKIQNGNSNAGVEFRFEQPGIFTSRTIQEDQQLSQSKLNILSSHDLEQLASYAPAVAVNCSRPSFRLSPPGPERGFLIIQPAISSTLLFH